MVQPRDLPRIIDEAKKGRLEFRVDRTAIIHCPVGKVSFPPEHLMANIASLVDAVVRARPATVKGSLIRAAHLSSSMSPGIRLDVSSLVALKPEL
jgi:large subunit ribosomal protein L1